MGNVGDKGFFTNNQVYCKIDCYVCAKCGYIEFHRGAPIGKCDDLDG